MDKDTVERCAQTAEIPLNEEQVFQLEKGVGCLMEPLQAYRLAQKTIAAAIRALKPWQPQWRHKKRGSEYELVGMAEVQVLNLIQEGDLVAVYRAKDGKLWVRPEYEFFDGRFEKIKP